MNKYCGVALSQDRERIVRFPQPFLVVLGPFPRTEPQRQPGSVIPARSNALGALLASHSQASIESK